MRKGLAAAGVVALIAAGSAACGSDEQVSAGGKVQNAFDKLGDQKSLTMGVHFGGSADEIYAAMKDEDDFTKDDAKMLADLQATFSVSSGKPLSEVKSGDKGGSFGLQLSGDDGKKSVFELRSVDEKMYVRLDLAEAEKLDKASGASGKDGDLAGLDQLIGSPDKLPSSLGSVKAALKGQWVSIDPKAFGEFAKSMGGKAGGDADADGSGDSPLSGLPDTKSLDAKTQRQLVEKVKQAVAHHAKFTDLGNHDGADHIRADVPARPFVKELETGLAPLTKQIPGFKPGDLSDVPNKTVSVDLAIKSGKISAITLDVAQFDTEATGKLPLVVDIDGGADQLKAPEGAQQLNPQDLMGLFMFGFDKTDKDADFTKDADLTGEGFAPEDGSLFS